MIQFTVTDASPADGPVFAALSRMFAELAGLAPTLPLRATKTHAIGGISVTTHNAPIPAEDNPGTGAPEGDEVFGTQPDNSFGVGVDAVSTTVLTPVTSLVAPLPVPSPLTANANGVTVDADGLPWDVRIHSTPAKINAGDKKWKAKRGVGATIVPGIEAELRLALSAGNVALAPAAIAPVPAPASLSSAVALPLPLPVLGAVAAITAAPNTVTTPPHVAAAAGGSPITMSTIMTRVTAGVAAGTITAEQANDLAAGVSDGKVKTMVMLAVAPQLLQPYADGLTALGVA